MPTAPGFADISMRFQLATFNRPAYITFGVDPVDTDPQLVAQNVAGAWNTSGSMNSGLDSNVTMTEVTARLGTDGGEDLIGTFVNITVGGQVTSSPTPNVAILVYKRTARGGRRGRGRVFLPWWCNIGNIGEDGVITPAALATMQTKVNTWRTTLVANSVPMVVLHGPGKTAMGPPDPVTSLVLSNVVATQRRRLGR